MLCGLALHRCPSPQAASKKQGCAGLSSHVPGAKPARPRRCMVFLSDTPSCPKSHVRPSCPPKSEWQLWQVTYEASCDVLTTLPGTFPVLVASLNSGAAWLRPTPFLTLVSRAAVSKRILPSRSAGGSGSTVGSTVRSPVMLATGGPRITGTHWAVCTTGGAAQSASTLHAGPPGWLQKPPLGGQSLVVPQVAAGWVEHRRFCGVPPASGGKAAASGTTLRER